LRLGGKALCLCEGSIKVNGEATDHTTLRVDASKSARCMHTKHRAELGLLALAKTSMEIGDYQATFGLQ
jgi:hypothetical protein